MAEDQSIPHQHVKKEAWRPVVGFEGLYEVSNFGAVRSVPKVDTLGRRVRAKVMTNARPASGGYPTIRLSLGGKVYQRPIHILVLEAFVGPRPVGHQGCHEDNDRGNFRLDNLRWDTPAGNNADKVRHGTAQRGTRNPNHKLTDDDVVAIRTSCEPTSVVANRYGITTARVRQLRRGQGWQHVPAFRRLKSR